MTKEEMRARLKEAGKKGYMIYALCDELREESEAKDKQIDNLLEMLEAYKSDVMSLETRNYTLERKCETCECAKFADEMIKPSKTSRL